MNSLHRPAGRLLAASVTALALLSVRELHAQSIDWSSGSCYFLKNDGVTRIPADTYDNEAGGFLQLIYLGPDNTYDGWEATDDAVHALSWMGQGYSKNPDGRFYATATQTCPTGSYFVIRFFEEPSPNYSTGAVPMSGYYGVTEPFVSTVDPGGSGTDDFAITNDHTADLPVPYDGLLVLNRGPSGVTSNSANLNGEVFCAASTTAAVRIHWGLTDGGSNAPAWDAVVPLGALTTGTFTTTVTGLLEDTTYYYRCWASNSTGVVWAGSSTSFKTAAWTPIDPTIVWRTGDGYRLLEHDGATLIAGDRWHNDVGGFLQLIYLGADNAYDGWQATNDVVYATSWVGVGYSMNSDGRFYATVAQTYPTGSHFVIRFFEEPSPNYSTGAVPLSGYYGVTEPFISTIDPEGAGVDLFAITNDLTAGIRVVPDTDGDDIPDWWEEKYFGGSTNAVPQGDEDGDGHSNLQEYYAGTDPTNRASCFAISTLTATSGPMTVLEWSSESNKEYSVFRSTNLADGFLVLTSGLPAEPPQNTYTDNVSGAVLFYRIRVD